ALDRQAEAGEAVGDGGGVEVRRQRDELAQPRDGSLHRAPPSSERLKRMSPSTKSRRSGALLRNMTVRSTPMPKAKPEYTSLSMPQAARTRGLTTPQPPHSIQPSLRQVRHG